MKLRNLAGAFLAFAATFGFLPRTAFGGDIYDIQACRGPEGSYVSYSSAAGELPRYKPGESMVAGETAYVKIRLQSRQEDDKTFEKNNWEMALGFEALLSNPALFDKLEALMDGDVLPEDMKPSIGVYVSGSYREATYVTTLKERDYLTDFVFAYKTRPGDFALPIVLAMKGKDGKTYPANDPNDVTEYCLDLKGLWQLRYKMADGSYVADVQMTLTSVTAPIGTIEKIRDWTLHKAGYRIRTLDFDPKWEAAGTLWRSVHEDSTITVGNAPQLVAQAASENAITLYVWSTNEAAVIVQGGVETEMPDPADATKTIKYHVAPVTLAAGATRADFSIKGVKEGESSGLILSAYPHFNKNDDYNDIRDDFVTVPVTCIEPMPPSVVVETSTSTAVAGSDYKKAAARLTVRLTQAVSTPITVRIEPRLSDGTDISTSEKAGQYVRFSKSNDQVGTLPDATNGVDVTIGPGTESTATIYVFCLRGDTHTTGVNELQFAPVKEKSSGSAVGEIVEWTAGGFNVEAQTPLITAPTEGEIFEAIQFDPTPITIKVEGSYADTQSDEGYEVWVKLTPKEAKFSALADASGTTLRFKPGEGNVLYLTNTVDVLPTLMYTATSTAESPWRSQIYVKAPVSGKSSAPDAVYRSINAVVQPAKSSSVTAFNATTGAETQEFDEGNRVKFQIEISDTYDSDLYAFLKPSENITDCAIFKGTTPFIVGMENCKGLRIGRGKQTAEGIITMLDGWNPEDGGLNFSVEVVLRDKQEWDAAGARTIGGFDCTPLDLTVNNVEPSITRVELDGNESEGSGYRYPNKLAMNTSHSVRAIVKDVSYDLENTTDAFQCKWTAYLENVAFTNATIKGNPGDETGVNDFKFNFPAAGIWTIRLQVKDKDMADWLATDYKVEVEVLDRPTLIIGADEYYNETDTKGVVSLAPSHLDPGVTLTAKIIAEPYRTGIENPGSLVFETNEVVFTTAAPQKLRILSMDGTGASASYGIRLTATITGGTGGGKTAEEWAAYYMAADTRIFIENEAPNGGDESKTFSPDANTNRWAVSSGPAESHKLRYFIRTDVDDDFTNTYSKWTTAGIKVTVLVGGSAYQGEGYDEKGVRYFTEPGDDTIIPDFSGMQGDQDVTITVEDKDGGELSRTWLFTVERSKPMRIVAHGPSAGNGTANSKRYRAASGIGEGRVFAEGKFTGAKTFESSYNFDNKLSTAKVYGYGYKVGDRYEGSATDGRFVTDTVRWRFADPLNANWINGLGASGGGTGFAYAPMRDKNGKEVDSFLYTWLSLTRSAENGSLTDAIMGNAFSPEYTELANSGTLAGLVDPHTPTGGNSQNTSSAELIYDDTLLEAIFAREYLATDNMGDINQDGIPDIYVDKYGFGVIDLTTGILAEEGTDLKDLSSYNGDLDKDGGASPDFLPNFITAGLLNREEFSAAFEIRGYGEGLNNAPELAGIVGVKPDRVYAEGVETEPGVTNWMWTKACTLSELEFAAWTEFAAGTWPDDPEAWTKAENWEKWSPERPTSPVLDDTDGDGFSDGFEYYFWYRAHVGDPDVFKATGRHVRLTGRRYDARNPGEGVLITSEEIEATFDPIVKNGDGETAKITDTDNDGLPDLLEFLIGTNPIDFDTDGDGLPDGWELCNVGNLDPLDPASHLDGKSDTVRNSDGDAMAITSYALEKTQKPVPADIEHAKRTTFAVIDPNGDTDGVQWYATRMSPEEVLANMTAVTNAASVWSFESDGRTFIYVSPVKPPLTADGRLAKTLAKDVTFVSKKPVEVPTLIPEEDQEPDGPTMKTNYVAAALYPVRLEAGVPVRMLYDEPIDGVVTTLAADIAEKDANACWIYGKGPENALYGDVAKTAADYGCLALGRYKGAKKGAVVCALPSDERDVAFLHYLVYQEFGFDPRTAWKAKDPLATRWSKSIDGESVEGITQIQQGGYTGAPSRTRDYANYDEFLVYSFFVNNGCDMSGKTRITDPEAPNIVVIWDAFTTNPQGPNEKTVAAATESDKKEGETTATTTVKSYGRGTNGADTDLDGVPDGWELYVMAGPKNGGAYVFAHPYAGFATGLSQGEEMPESYFSPFLDFAKGTETSNQIYLGGQQNDDTLNEFKEFEGTDSIAYYAVAEKAGDLPYSTTIVHDGEWTWFNKFFPTDPWNVDTDGDGLKDNEEKGAFAYGTPADDGKLWSIPGGGLNPCSMDTDLDGIPDPWENQYKGKTVYAGDNPKPFYAKDADGNEVGNPLEGLTDGMDGTVPDAYNVVNGSNGSASGQTTWTVITSDGRRWSGHVNRDYDRDGLENWQEYLTGTMRCWRYDDPYSPWTAIPKEMYYTYDAKNAKWAWDPKYEQLGCNKDNPDEFWYKTLVDRESGIYNPHLVVDSVCGQYFSKVTNAWDVAYLDSTLSGGKKDGAWYFLYDRIGPDMIKDIWVGTALDPKRLFGITKTTAPTKYMGCSPLEYDSDKDGMDDYYELFHGLNPMLGESGVNLASEGPCDLVFDAWRGGETGVDGQFEAWGDSTTANWWQRNPKKGLPNGGKSRSLVPGGYDFEVYPWLNGLQMADPDGDDMRNVYEAVMPRFADDAWHHTDPTPLWMTDTSYADSIVRRFFCLPTRFDAVSTANESFFGGDGTEYFFRDMSAGWVASPSGNAFLPFVPDFWDLSASGAYNWICSFEENEGFDTDHDGTGDTEEASSRTRAATDPQDFDSPRRRQAMYFAGAEWPSVLQTMPEETERYPVATETYPDDASFRQYTVECWVKPDAPEGAEFPDMTILERAIWTGLSNPGDEEFMRKNFQLGIKNNRWYTKYDPDGTLKDTVVETFSTGTASTGWHHLAATYDGVQLVLYVDGAAQTPMKSSLAPERGMSALALRRNWGIGLQPGDYWFDREYSYKAFIIGARAKGRTELPAAVRETGYTTLDLAHGVDFSRYDGFFKGYVDEISVWDGARSFDDIYADYSERIRLDRTVAIANRSEFYKKWSVGGRRYAADLSGTSSSLVPELRYHWSFDALFGAENPGQVAIEPHGFSAAGKPILSRPKDYVVNWWSQVVGDSDSVYAGNLDWVPWIHNTVAHLPRFDTTTLDSMFWSENFCGATNGTYAFPRTAEPVSRWTQFAYNGVNRASRYQTASSRHHLVFEQGWSPSNTTTLVTQFEFTGRHLNQTGDDLLPLGGAFVKYVDTMWDDQGASSMWEQTGEDSTANGLPDWWEEYADQNYRPKGMDPGSEIDWNTELVRDGVRMTAGEAYPRDLAAGMYVDADRAVHPTKSDREAGILKTPFEQTAKSDGLIPDWWKSLYKIDGEGPLVDNDNDGLDNYVEYMASELLPFGFRLNPLMPRTDTVTLDYFRKVGKLYVGEMLTDHDQMEDHWERSLANAAIADATLWDALKDVDGDGWNNFAENRYNGYRMSTLAQLASHAVGDDEALDAPIPSVTLTVRYNGSNLGAAKDAKDSGKSGENADNKEASTLPNLVVRAYTKTGGKPDAEYVLAPGQTVDREVYIGGWEDRVVRGTMSPGNIDLGSVNIKFAQIPQSDIYSWTDENGRHLAGTYAEFKEAFDRNPDIIQNIQDFTWLELVAPVNQYTSSDRAVTVSREKLTQTGYIAVYGERVGTVDLTTGEFEFDLAAMNNLRVNYTYDGGKGPEAAWSYKEAIFKITYSAKVPAVQADRFQVTLAKADTGFMKGGKNSFTAFFDNDGNGEYTPGEPFGVLNDVEIGWSGRTLELELTDMSAITPRIDLWSAETDRAALTAAGGPSNEFIAVASAPARQCRVSVVRHRFNEDSPYDCGIIDNAVVYEGDFTSDARTLLHEGDFLASGLDIDWDHLYADAVADEGTYRLIGALTNVTYLVVFDGQIGANPQGKDTKALAAVITRRFEVQRRKPTPCLERMVFNRARPTFAWTIEGEDPWAAKFGTTYTAFKVRVRTLSGDLVYESDVTRMPAKDSDGVYAWTAPLYVGARTAQGVVFENLTDYTWEIALYNAKFSTDTVLSSDVSGVRDGNPFSARQVFRMNVTHQDLSSCSIAVAVRYAGPAMKLADRIRVQAFESPDFTGDPVAEKIVGTADQVVVLDGLAEGDYFIRAYIDTNENGVHDEWESWGYLCERDLANKSDVFNPVIARSRFNADEKNVRTVHIEDCDTDGDWFPDVWEAEQNGGVFVAFKSGKGQGPVDGNAELIGVNTNLDANLTKATKVANQMMRALNSPAGVSLMTGISPTDVESTANGFEVKSEVKSDTLTIVGLSVDTANGRVLLKVGAETTANVDPTVASFLNITVRKGAEVTVRVEHAETPAGPWTELKDVGGTVTVDKAGADIEVKLDGELPAQGYFRAKVEE